MLYDVIIIGKGPAGISASLYTSRAKLNTLILAKNDSDLVKTDKIENYYGFIEPISGKDLLNRGAQQALRLGVRIKNSEVISIKKNNHFEVKTPDSEYTSKSVLLATGQPQLKVKIPNIKDYEGKGVSYCSTCDGFFYNNKKIGVIGYKDYAIHEALELKTFSQDITILTNGNDLKISDKYNEIIKDFKINTHAIANFDGDEFLSGVRFLDGTYETLNGVFMAYGSASSADFARKLGIFTNEDSIIIDSKQRTNFEGIFAAGDCTGGFKQISVSVGQGAIAGRGIIEYLR